MTTKEQLLQICNEFLAQKGLAGDERYQKRLALEFKEVEAQGEQEYLLSLHSKFKSEKLIFPQNEFNNLFDWALGLAPSHDIDSPSSYVMGEMPDIDVDFIKDVRDDLKHVWAAETFGQENVCAIGTYGTSGIKSAILDSTRLHSVGRDEIQAITTKMADKDDEGHELEWEKALEIYPDFKAYCERFPDVAHDAFMALDRNKSSGVHAGGLIIADRRLDGFVPLEVRSVTKDNPDGVICSAWTEGLNRQDLGPVGLIKFDLLVINNLMQIALACKFVKERYGLQSICAHPNSWDWSDISYLNDPKSLEMANKGDLKCIFQFDSEGIRKMVKKGGVTSFNDLVAYSSLYRPGPLGMGMDATYCKRKRGLEPFNIHPIMQRCLGVTYGVMCFQEQVMDILSRVGRIPDMHTEKVRKAISKKKVKEFIKYKEMFIENGQQILNVNAEYVLNLWEQIESFAEYGFNKSHSCAYSYISARLLWLKAHYPLEFYTAILMCENDHEKLKDYKLDADYHGVKVCPIHINNSRTNFNINDGKIFFGFSNIKGIGEGVAERVVAEQPYKNFQDFLERFGTESTPIKAFTSLGIFEEEHDRLHLRKYAEFYKEFAKKRRERQKRFETGLDKKLEELKKLLLEEVKETDPDFEKLHDFSADADALWQTRFEGVVRQVPYKHKGIEKMKKVTFVKLLQDLSKKRENSIKLFHEKEKDDDEGPLTLDQFNANSITLDPEEEEILTNELNIDGVKSYPQAESLYYGFQWTHVLETCSNYTGATIDKFLDEAESNPLMKSSMIEVEIKQVQKRTSKGERATVFYSVTVEDANAKQMKITIWSDDFTRFKDELKAGNLVKIRVRPPGGGFNTLTFDSVERHKRKFLPPKEDDHRLILMKAPAPQKPVKAEAVLDELKFDADAIIFQPPVESAASRLQKLAEEMEREDFINEIDQKVIMDLEAELRST